jgi:hypothetical protein
MRSTLSVKKRPLVVPEQGQRVRLRTARGRWRGSYRAVSEPFTDEGGVVVLRVAEEEEYRAAKREGRRAIGMPWPVRQMEGVLPPAGSEEGTGELPTRFGTHPTTGSAQERPQSLTQPGRRRGRLWRRILGG